MAHLFNRNVLLGVSGGIAAYKSAELVRQLQNRGATVRVIMTRGAREFITPLTLQALSGQPVHTELLDEEAERGMGHIELARWADLLLIAPATADLIARLATGRADDLLTTVTLATSAPSQPVGCACEIDATGTHPPRCRSGLYSRASDNNEQSTKERQ